MAQRRIIRIGTAGWSIPKQYADRFPGAGTHLERYARVMNAAEINSSFYRPHQHKTYERWADSTPASFRFAVKAPRQLTHTQRLREPEDGLDRFAGEVAGLGAKLGVVLVQLPPSLTFEASVAGDFFDALASRLSAPIVCEPRHKSWFAPEVDGWLAARKVARAAADPSPAPGADTPGGWPGLTYTRLHGSPRIYYSAYDTGALDGVAASLKQAHGPAWCVFDNTAAFAAQGDAVGMTDRFNETAL
jgi:uncharacterized protein YecE (DUF72 family)